jgi:putative transposase
MPRSARIKSFDSIYHIMCRSISDVSLFRDKKDKDQYLDILKKNQELFHFKVYCFCLMNTHCHLIIDVNGADISKIFHGINQSYAFYFNRKYKRHGHVFQDRFKSVIVDSDLYLITLSGYIHANPLSIKKFKDCPEKYQYSSLGIYLGINEDKQGLLDNKSFVIKKFSENSISEGRMYIQFVEQCKDKKMKETVEFKNDGTRYESSRTILPRNYEIDHIINYITTKTNCTKETLRMKNNKKSIEYRALCVFFMRCFCNYKQTDICRVIGNITQSRVSKLCVIGMEMAKSKKEYKNLVDEFIKAA